jgi:predicted phage terminase large subunit-like protein
MLTADDIKTLKVSRVWCQQSMLNFTRYFFKQRFNRKLLQWEQIVKMCEVLDKVVRGEITHLIVNVAPRYGKTEVIIKNFMAYGLAINPASKFIHLSYADDLALDNSEEARDIVQSAAYRQLFPEVVINKSSDSKKKWYTTAKGGVYATAAGGQVTGFGAGKVDDDEAELDDFLAISSGFAGALLIDDPIKPEDADSDRIRERVNMRYDSTIKNRVNSRNTPIIITAQRTHEEDLCGHVIKNEGLAIDGGKWHVLSLPSIKEDGTALCAQKHTIEELRELERINPVVFERQHMQNPQPLAGLLFPKSELQYYNPEQWTDEKLEQLAQFKFFACDPADTGGDDLSVPFGYLIENRIYIPHVIYNTDGVDLNEPELFHQIKTRNINAGVIEGNGGWKLFAQNIKTRVLETMEDCRITIIKNSTNKHTRILAMAPFIRNKFLFRADYEQHPQYNKFMKCLTSYAKVQEGTTKSKHDDAPDSCAEMARYYQQAFAHVF